MYSNRSEYSHRQPHGDRRSGHWDPHGDGWEKRHEPHRDLPRDSFRKYSADGHCDSSPRKYSREWDRRSPRRRPVSPPVWDSSERKRPRYSDDDKSDHRYQCEPQKRTYRHSADSFSRDFKKSPPQNKDYKYRETPQDSRHRYRLEEFENNPRHDGSRRRSSVSYRERDSHESTRDRSQERSRSQERYRKIPVKTRTIPDSPANSTYQEDYHQTAQLWQNGSSKQAHESDVTTQHAKVPVQEHTEGFQRFLAVLNKGVDVDTLTKIVTQSNRDDAPSPAFNHVATATEPPQNRSESRQQSPSPKRSFQYEEEVLEKKTTQPPVDESKCRQMQDVLQAIGIDLGFEELGQMSHRIQERLYGRKDEDLGCRVSRENSSRLPNSPQRRSGSSSSRSSFTPLPRDCAVKQDSHGSQTDAPEVQQAQQGQSSEYQLGSGSQEDETCEPASGSSFTYPPSVLPPTPMMPPYNPSSTLLYPPLSSPPPPVLPQVSPWMVLPQQPPFYPFPTVPPVSVSPTVPGQNSPSFQNPQPMNAAQRHAKALQRERCLQVIETKPG